MSFWKTRWCLKARLAADFYTSFYQIPTQSPFFMTPCTEKKDSLKAQPKKDTLSDLLVRDLTMICHCVSNPGWWQAVTTAILEIHWDLPRPAQQQSSLQRSGGCCWCLCCCLLEGLTDSLPTPHSLFFLWQFGNHGKPRTIQVFLWIHN